MNERIKIELIDINNSKYNVLISDEVSEKSDESKIYEIYI